MIVVWRDLLKEKIWLNISDWCLEESSRQYFVWLTTTYFPCLEGCVWKKTTFEYVLVKSDHKDFWPCLEGCVWKSTLNQQKDRKKSGLINFRFGSNIQSIQGCESWEILGESGIIWWWLAPQKQ